MNSGSVAETFLVLFVLIIIFGPLLAIWSLNALFGLGIAYSLKTWFAALVLMGIVGGSKSSFSRS